MKRTYALLLVSFFLLAGCRAENLPGFEHTAKTEQTETITAPAVTLTNVYSPTRLQDNGLIVGSTQAYAGLAGMVDAHHIKHKYGDENYLYCLERRMDNNQWTIAVFDWDGNLVEHRDPPPFEGEYGYSKDQRWLSDGGAVFLHGETNKDTTVYRLAADGTVTGTLELPGVNKNDAVLAVSDTYTAVACEGTLRILDTAYLRILYEHSMMQQMETLDWRDDGMLVGQNSRYMLMVIDPLTGTGKQLYPVAHTGNDVSIRQYYGPGYDVYMTRAEGIFGVMLTEDGKGEETLLVSWENSFLTPEGTRIEWIGSPERIFVRTKDNVHEMHESVILFREQDETLTERTEVVLAYFLETADGTELRRLVSAFNRESDAYFLRLVQYPRVIMSQNIEEASKKLFGEMEAGNAPDLLILSADMEALYRNLHRQGYLADLTKLSERLTGSARSAVRFGETCTRIPVNIRYKTLVSCEVTEVLDMEILIASAEKYPILFSEDVSLPLMGCVQNAFVDWQSMTADFDTDLFRQYMTMLGKMQDMVETDYGTVDAELGLRFTNSDLPVYAAEGKLPFVPTDLYTIETFGALKMALGETGYTICGYPDTMAVPELPISLAVLKSGKNVPGARAFLEFALSDAVQTSDMVAERSFPVTSSGVKLLLENTCYYYSMHTGDEDNNGIPETKILLEASSALPMESYESKTDVQRAVYDAEDKGVILAFLENENVSCVEDPTVRGILFEELYTYRSGDRTMEDMIRVLQSRVSTYLAE